MKLSFFFCLSALVFGACNTAQKSDKHTFRSYVRYLEDQAQLRAEAVVYGPDSAAVEPPGGILYDGLDMTAMPVKGAGYRYQRNGAVGESAHFSWAGDKGDKHEFTVPILPIADFGFGPGPISRQHPDTLRWTGTPLDRGETLVLMWENLDKGQTVPMEIYGTAPQKEIVFPAAQLAKLTTAGRWSLYLVRRKLVKGDAGGIPATGTSEYYTRADTVEVK